MSPVLRRRARATDEPAQGHGRTASTTLDGGTVPARIHPWPNDDGVAQLILLDSTAVPMAAQFQAWADRLAALGYHTMRTGALASRAAAQAESAGMRCIQELALLEAHAPFIPGAARIETRRVKTRPVDDRRFDELAEIDRSAFGEQWSLDGSMLRDVMTATPEARARGVRRRDVTGPERSTDEFPAPSFVGFLLCGRSGTTGYVQRLAVDPRAQRRGAASALLDDAFAWFRRGRVGRAMVNTDVANEPALELYHRHGFRDLTDRLRVFEGPTTSA